MGFLDGLFGGGGLTHTPEGIQLGEAVAQNPDDEQARLAYAKYLTAAGSSKERVLQMRVYISDVAHWGAVNEVYAAFFGDHKPVRAIITTRELHYGCLIEIEGTALAPSKQ